MSAFLKYRHNLPSFSIDPDDLIFGKIRVCADESDPVLPVLLVTDTDDLCRELLIFPDHEIHGEKISVAARTFFQIPKIFLMEHCSSLYS